MVPISADGMTGKDRGSVSGAGDGTVVEQVMEQVSGAGDERSVSGAGNRFNFVASESCCEDNIFAGSIYSIVLEAFVWQHLNHTFALSVGDCRDDPCPMTDLAKLCSQ
jgi:hypothetical protein